MPADNCASAARGVARALKPAVLLELAQTSREYYAWEQEHSYNVLQSLAVTKPSRSREPLLTSVADGQSVAAPDSRSTEASDALTRYDAMQDRWAQFIVMPEAGLVATPIAPHAAYESCTPIDQNILHGDDSNFMPFVPLADDPSFDSEDHVMEYKRLAWQEPYRDSDTLEITLETSRRISQKLHLSPEELDAMEVLPLILSTSSAWGAIWTGKQNDAIDWPGSSRTVYPLVDVMPPLAGNLRLRLQDYLTLWCPTPDCTQAMCFSHSLDQAKLTLDSCRYKAEPFKLLFPADSCGDECILRPKSGCAHDVEWTGEELDDLRVIAHIGGTITSCDLARLCRKPCHEISLMCKKHRGFSGFTADTNAVTTQEHVVQTRSAPASSIRLAVLDCADVLGTAQEGGKGVDVRRAAATQFRNLVRAEIIGHVEGRSVRVGRQNGSATRRYVFGLNDVFSVDAANAGNPSRFINHAPSRKANVAACILLVNGHQRIGVFAKKRIAAGAELFMDYGPEYPLVERDEEK
ncbi:hypothetical protein BN946_scf184943.g20 [Trametes cinnabarina]|uniref:SET domain-containing protein n=1 Tax=Pycnoporus cinnabarinus TaxID=5643 RepID=A0A060SCP1_PYCCI|nr:hypothetical protein BN946_scf184943.g20 [Trametes cinnabarina]